MDKVSTLVASAIGAAVLSWAAYSTAYPLWSVAKDATYCAACHGAFTGTTYDEKHGGQTWGVDLMQGHVDSILGGAGAARCDVCHLGAAFFPVDLGTSNGTGALAGISCAGCHGRAEDNNPPVSGYSAGLRQHHYRHGATLCVLCHADSDPAVFTPVGENVQPPYYGTGAFPLLPTDACNPTTTEESSAGSSLGLDNDGDNATADGTNYDMSDTDCVSCGDGIVSPGETCDPPASCPATCDDGDACTDDVTSGAAATCDIACSHSAIVACTDGDGCCAPGCTHVDDDDCASGAGGAGGSQGGAGGGAAGGGGGGIAAGGAGGSGQGASGAASAGGSGTGASSSVGGQSTTAAADSGCGCHVGSRDAPRGGRIGALGVFALTLLRLRRRRTRPVVTTV